jgi:two-component system, response regulator FlrC
MTKGSRVLKTNTLYIVDIQPHSHHYISYSYSTDDMQTVHFGSAEHVLKHPTAPSLLLVDAELPDMALPDFVARYHQIHPQTQIIVMVNTNQSQQASEALRLGAIDYLQKPFTADQLRQVILDTQQLLSPQDNLIAASNISQKVLQLARRAAHTDASILITGESGTGKECLARFIHDHSPRNKGAYVAVNCAAIPENMLEAMLFGVSKGAYTGAIKSQAGKFEQANGGTLLLDEIAEMPLPLQAKLLRVIQEREVERLGSHTRIPLNIRLIASTNRDLRSLVAQGLFRADLYYRLDVLPLCWPGLRERTDDILPLAQHFLKKHAAGEKYQFSQSACQTLVAYHWPGNVRELENVIQRALILAKGLYLQPADLLLTHDQSIEIRHSALRPEPIAMPAKAGSLSDNALPPMLTATSSLAGSKRQAEFQYVLEVLRNCEGHRTRAAEMLGMTTRALRYKLAAMRENGINIDSSIHI